MLQLRTCLEPKCDIFWTLLPGSPEILWDSIPANASKTTPNEPLPNPRPDQSTEIASKSGTFMSPLCPYGMIVFLFQTHFIFQV